MKKQDKQRQLMASTVRQQMLSVTLAVEVTNAVNEFCKKMERRQLFENGLDALWRKEWEARA